MITFEGTGLDERILRAIDDLGFKSPTPIQEMTIPHILNSTTDLVALAQTGTGKTAAFGLPVIQKVNEDQHHTQAMILCPTRELCIQISKDLNNYSKYFKKLNVVPVYGGENIMTQIRALRSGAQIVVGTPGRVNDLIKRKVLDITTIEWLVLDEADEMLNMGFKDELDSILSTSPKEKQTLLFSATMPKEIARISEEYMNNPERFSTGKQNSSADNIKHEYYLVGGHDKYQALKRVLDVNPDIYGIVFCRTRKEAKEIADDLIPDGYNADALHGDLSQVQRDLVMTRFRSKHLQVLVATDVAARGLDVTDLTHVINFNLPDDPEVYIHRSGRTGRAGKSGVSLSIIAKRELGKIDSIARILKKPITQEKVPSGQEICEKQLYALVDKVVKVEVENAQIEKYLETVNQQLAHLDRDELIKHFVSVEFNDMLNYYKDAVDINISSTGRTERSSERGAKRTGNYTRFFINLGARSHDLTKVKLMELITKSIGKHGIDIGDIEIMKKFSFFEIDKQYEKDVLKALNSADYKGTDVSVEVSKDKIPTPSSGGGRRSFHSGGGGGYRGGDNRGSESRGGGDRDRDRKPFRGGDEKKSYGKSDRTSSSRGEKPAGWVKPELKKTSDSKPKKANRDIAWD